MKQQRFEAFKSLLQATYADARAFKEEGGDVNALASNNNEGKVIAPSLRIKDSYDYYYGVEPKPFGPNEPVEVFPVVFPKIQELTAAICEILDSTSNTVSYTAPGVADKDVAGIATKFIQRELDRNKWNDQLQSIVPESLIAGVSFVKRYWEEREEERVNRYKGVTKEQFDSIKLASPDSEFTVEGEDVLEVEQPIVELDPQTQQPVQTGVKVVKVKTFDILERYTEQVDGLKIEWVPQKEIYTLAHDNSVEDASYLCQRKLVYRYQIREQFPERKYKNAIDTAIPDSYLEEVDTDDDYNSLQKIGGNISSQDNERDKLFLFEQYIRFGKKLYQVFSAGLESNVLEYKEVDEIPFNALIPIRASDSLWSISVADNLKSLQNIKTETLRHGLVNARRANYERYMAVKNQYDRKSLLDNRPSGVVEMNAPGMIAPFQYHQLPASIGFIEQEVNQAIEEVAGSSQGTNGAIEKLMNASATGASIAASMKELREKNLVRNMITTGIAPLYKALYAIVRDNVKDVSIITVDGQQVPVQPAEWPQEIDIKVDIVTRQDRFVKSQNISSFFAQVSTFRQAAVTPNEWMEFAAELAESLGQPELMDLITPPEEIPQPQPSPAEQLELQKLEVQNREIEAGIQKAQIEAQIKQAQMDLELQKATLEAQIEANKISLEEAKLQYETQNTQDELSDKRKNAQLDGALTYQMDENVKLGNN